ncbi:MAG: hypothetical protein KDB71_18475 [Mycobacterium sp.]|nr:hypothetical protein [Mycobacterium sp.]
MPQIIEAPRRIAHVRASSGDARRCRKLIGKREIYDAGSSIGGEIGAASAENRRPMNVRVLPNEQRFFSRPAARDEHILRFLRGKLFAHKRAKVPRASVGIG